MGSVLLTSLAFALFVICPRMAGMTNIIAKATGTNVVVVALLGTAIALPLIVVMVLIFQRFGVVAALAFCVLTDLAAALTMSQVSMKACVETAVVALFVLVGVKVASFVSGLLP
jgi:hypothetical protein